MRNRRLSNRGARRHAPRFEVSATELLVDALAAYRLTRLANVDTFPAAATVRDRVTGWARESGHPTIEELVHCPWCIGFWIAAAVVTTRKSGGRVWDPIARTLAISAASGMIAHSLSDEVVQVKPVASEEQPPVVESLREVR
jgi:Protein of unknown function (DUF1360)